VRVFAVQNRPNTEDGVMIDLAKGSLR